jgi:hypothetical protein
MVPSRVEAKLSAIFQGSDLQEALDALPGRPAGSTDHWYDLLLMSITKLSEGQLERLKYFAERALVFPEDVVQLGQTRELRSTIKPRKRTRGIPHLSGGPVALPDVPPNPLADDEDIWEGLGIGAAMLCSVCRKEYGSPDPEIWLYRVSEGGGRSASRIHVHPRCLQAGEALALSQGYGWHHGSLPTSNH